MTSTNDPRETDPWFFGMTVEDEENGPTSEEFFEASRTIDRILKGSCKLVCLSQDMPDPDPTRGDPDDFHRPELVQGYAHDRMWAQYAENHMGVCIFFDREKLTQRLEEHFRNRRGCLMHGPVAYLSGYDLRGAAFDVSWEEIRRLGIEAYAEQHREAFARQLYLTKNPDWANEQEYRYIWIEGDVQRQGNEELIEVGGCISAICLGAHFLDEQLAEVEDIRKRLGLKVHRIWYRNGMMTVAPAFSDPPREETPPTLAADESFGAAGIAVTAVKDSSNGHCVLVQPDGKIVLGGGIATLRRNGTLRDEGFALARYLPDGNLDTAFGCDGIVLPGPGGGHRGVQALTVQPDGMIVAAGTSWVERAGRFTIARYRLDGGLDPEFGADGTIVSEVVARAEASAVALQEDGKIVVGGVASVLPSVSATPSEFGWVLVRYEPSGEVDPGFGRDGKVVIPVHGSALVLHSVVVQPDGKILLVGAASGVGRWIPVVARHLSDGSPDRSFGYQGLLLCDWGRGGQSPAAAALLPKGKLIVAGSVCGSAGSTFVLTRLQDDGTQDTEFGQGGLVQTTVGTTGTAYVYSVLALADGKLVCGGNIDGRFGLVRYTSKGLLDSTFGDGGIGTTRFVASATPQVFALQLDGKIVAAGSATMDGRSAFAVARFVPSVTTQEG